MSAKKKDMNDTFSRLFSQDEQPGEGKVPGGGVSASEPQENEPEQAIIERLKVLKEGERERTTTVSVRDSLVQEFKKIAKEQKIKSHTAVIGLVLEDFARRYNHEKVASLVHYAGRVDGSNRLITLCGVAGGDLEHSQDQEAITCKKCQRAMKVYFAE